jgi:hypothetical protein
LLPVAAFPGGENCTDNYAAIHKRYTIHRATSLRVIVDFKRKAVVWIIPQPIGAATA